MSIRYGIDKASSNGRKGAYDSVVPYGHNAGSVLREAHSSTVEIIHHDAQQLLLAI